ncbi:MAG: lipoyl(octanoyl) transferase LipB [Candidatus Aquicultorales bacterium]
MEYAVIECGTIPVPTAAICQKRLAGLLSAGRIGDLLLLAEHPHTFACGSAFKPAHLLWNERRLRERGVETLRVDRGGGVTYHGPGQLVVYPILKLGSGADLIGYLRKLEETAIAALGDTGLDARRVAGRTGVWIGDRKICSIGVRYARGVVRHGIALNVDCDLSYFDGIIACGLEGVGQTSLALEGIQVDAEDFARVFLRAFEDVFGAARIGPRGALEEEDGWKRRALLRA